MSCTSTRMYLCRPSILILPAWPLGMTAWHDGMACIMPPPILQRCDAIPRRRRKVVDATVCVSTQLRLALIDGKLAQMDGSFKHVACVGGYRRRLPWLDIWILPSCNRAWHGLFLPLDIVEVIQDLKVWAVLLYPNMSAQATIFDMNTSRMNYIRSSCVHTLVIFFASTRILGGKFQEKKLTLNVAPG